MKIISDREFRNEPGKVRKELAGQNVVIDSNVLISTEFYTLIGGGGG